MKYFLCQRYQTGNIFTDTLSHSVYNTFIQQVREEQIPLGYIHGVNIEANVKQMWDELITDQINVWS